MSASIVEFPKPARKVEFPSPIRTATGALVTIFGVRLEDPKYQWDHAYRITLEVWPEHEVSKRPVTEDDCCIRLEKFVSQIGVSMHRKRPLPFVAVLEGSQSHGWYFEIILNSPDSLPDEIIFQAIHAAWSFDALPDVIHETSGEDEVRHLLGRTAFPIINGK